MKKLGFGFMRLPKLEDGQIDLDQVCRMVDAYLEAGFTYFDTAHGYLGGESEKAIKTCLSSRYPRERFVLTDKLSNNFYETEADVRPILDVELEACGVEYFDYVLLHAVNSRYYEKAKECRVFETLQAMKAEGKIRHIGISFHDTPEVLDQVLSEEPSIEAVQIQFNYLDEANPSVESRKCYEVCRKHGKDVLIMEPVKGGALAALPEQAAAILDQLDGGSYASYAIRYAASQEGVLSVLSGMSTLEQVLDNVSYMQNFQPMNEEELAAVAKVRDVILSQELIGCTGCRYCVDGCPKEIPIPDIFDVCNQKKQYLVSWRYGSVTKDKGKASDCVDCGQCEDVCPQKLNIRTLLKQAADIFE